jgi:hypothetical protein
MTALRLLILSISLAILTSTASADQKVPTEVGGFALGSNLDNYPEVVQSNFLKETVITDWHGFRKGIISHGVCKYPGQILKLRLKYDDSSKKFFQKLLKEYKRRYGAPHEWKGDSFGILHIWKWHFVDSEDRAVSLSLQHNLRNTSENVGNMVKMSLPGLIEEERKCFNQMCEDLQTEEDQQRLEERKKPNWDFMIPR